MPNITKAERHNRALERIFNQYQQHQESLPSCHLYGQYIRIAIEKLNVTEQEARARYGNYTVKEWESLLKLGWNK